MTVAKPSQTVDDPATAITTAASVADEDIFEMVDDIDTFSGGAARRYSKSASDSQRPPSSDKQRPPSSDRHDRLDPGSPESSLASLELRDPMPYSDDEKSGAAPSNISAGIKYTKSMYKKLKSSWGDKDIVIAVMGMTGSGKTSFIAKATGRDDLDVGHSLASCTREIQVFDARIDGQRVHFVDTPGFSDTTLSDTDVLQMIADYLAVAYKRETKLSGIIYLHPISDTRMTHHGVRNLSMFRRLTGEKNLKNVVLATSKWDLVDEAVGAARERELRQDYWQLLVQMGARTMRHDGTAASALVVARSLCANTPFYLQLQEEMGPGQRALRDTTAGRELMAEMARLKADHQREMEDMQDMMRNSADESKAVIEALRIEARRQADQLEILLRDERKMNEDAVRSLQDRIQALESSNGGRGCVVM